MPGVYLGTTNITNIRVGDAAASKVYVGTEQVWTSGAPPATFPSIVTTTTRTGTSLSTAGALAAPSGTTAGNLLVAFCSHDAASLMTGSTGWTMIARSYATVVAHGLAVFARVADGGANDTLTVTAAAQDYCLSILRITDHGVTDPATQIKVAGLPAIVVGTADSPNLNTGVSTNWLWLAAAALDNTTGSAISAAPAGYTNAHAHLSSAGSTGSSLSVAYRTNAASSENPGVWTNSSRVWVAATLAIPPPATTLPTFYVAGFSVLQTSGSGARDIQADAGAVPGDLLIVVSAMASDTFTLTPPAGWTELKANTFTGTLGSSCYAKIRAVGDLSYAFTVSGGAFSTYLCLNLRNTGSIGTIQIGADGTRAASGGTTATTAPSVTTTGVVNSLVLCLATERSSTTETAITSVDNGFTEYTFVPHGGGGTETIWVGTKSIAPALTPSGATTITYPNTQATNGFAFHLSVRSA